MSLITRNLEAAETSKGLSSILDHVPSSRRARAIDDRL